MLVHFIRIWNRARFCEIDSFFKFLKNGFAHLVYFALFNEDNFLKKAPIQGEVSEIKEGVAQITFSEVPSGTYAVTAYHDKNGNQQMDFESNGIPKENYGVSNNQMNLYGPPLWEDAKFEFDGSEKNLKLQF